MPVLLFFSFVSGLITIFAPCIWPLLPVILSSSASGGKQKALGMTLGITSSFAVLTLSISYLIRIIPFDPEILRLFAVFVIGILGLSLIVPALGNFLEVQVSRFSGKFLKKSAKNNDSFWTGFITGISLGIVWTPCAGPILATIATFASTQSVNAVVILITLVYVSGVGIPLFIFALVGNTLLTKSRGLSRYTGTVQRVFGVIMILSAFTIYTNFDKTVQTRLLNYFPSYGRFVNQVENSAVVRQELQKLKNADLPARGQAPDFVGIEHWLNSNPLTIAQLRGKVVLVDFWTYTCINCIRTLPHVQQWYQKYKDKGFVVIGVHTPEFVFEKKTENVQNAITQHHITYPVAQDNDYRTWSAYSNQYWPAKYLIDKDGLVRYAHFGEGEYDQTEGAIQLLLKENGKAVDSSTIQVQDQTPQGSLTPETYLGLLRLDRFSSIENPKEGKGTYTKPSSLSLHNIAFAGAWKMDQEYATADKDARLYLRFYADKVFLVITPAKKGDAVRVFLDAKPVSSNQAGTDVKNGSITLDTERLYNLIDLHGSTGDHVLQLQFEQGGSAVFAFTFG